MPPSLMKLKFTKMNYRRIKTLGRGAQGTVSLVYQIETKRKFTMKSIPFGNLKKRESENPINEVNLLKKLKHPNIIQCYGCGEENN